MIDGKATAFIFGGFEVDGVQRFQHFEGAPVDVPHRALNAPAAEARPGLPDYGIIRLTLVTSNDDEGQQALRLSLADRIIEPCAIVYDDGAVARFDAYCRTFPAAGGKAERDAVKSVVTLRVSGPVIYGGLLLEDVNGLLVETSAGQLVELPA